MADPNKGVSLRDLTVPELLAVGIAWCALFAAAWFIVKGFGGLAEQALSAVTQ